MFQDKGEPALDPWGTFSDSEDLGTLPSGILQAKLAALGPNLQINASEGIS